MTVAQIFLILVVLLTSSDGRDVKIIEILPTRPCSSTNDKIVVELNPNITFQAGYAICLRIKFRTWDNMHVFSSRNISLDLYASGKGSLTNGRNPHLLTWNKSIRMIPTFWNSVCLSYDKESVSVNLTINDVREVTSVEKSKVDLNKIAPVEMMLGGESFIGHISDFNFWSRPLSEDEIVQE
jgi:hypothetical protein